MASIFSASGLPSTLKRIADQPSTSPMATARPTITRMAVIMILGTSVGRAR
jgi:hypothetical protein